MLRLPFYFLIASVLLIVPTAGLAQKKKKGPAATVSPTVPTTNQDYAELNQQKEVLCKLVLIDPNLGIDIKNNKNLLFRYEYVELEANPNYKPAKPIKVPDHSKEALKLQQQ